MRYAIILLAIAALLTVGGTYLSQNQGYIELGLENGSYQMPLWYFLIALLVAIIAIIIAVKVLWTVIRLPKIAKRFNKKHRASVANESLQKGMMAMGKGEWKKAEKLLVKGSRLAHKAKTNPSLFLSTAAEAAQQQGAEARRDQYLLEARQLSVEGVDTLTSSLAEARLHLSAEEPELALESIRPHRATHSRNPQFIAIESEANEQLGNYRDVWHLLSGLKKQFPDKKGYQSRQIEVAKQLFIDEQSNLELIEKVWSELPKKVKQDDGVFLNYISGLINHHKEEKAEELLSKSVRQSFADPVIHAYTQLNVGSSAARLDKIKHWLKFHPENAYLNYGAAKFAFESDQMELARKYATTSIESQPLPEAFALLGKVYEALGESSNALKAYKGSVGLIYANQPEAVAGEILPANITAALPSADSDEVS